MEQTTQTKENPVQDPSVTPSFMDGHTDNLAIPFTVGEDVTGTIVAKRPSEVFVDLSPYGTGIIYGQEFILAKDVLRKVHIGDVISAKIISMNHPEGYIDLSLKEARQAEMWKDLEEGLKHSTVYEVVIKDANRGGLVVSWNGIRGFLPASHLSEKHYPKVLNGSQEAIVNELKKLVGEKLQARPITVETDTEKLIFSESTSGANATTKDGKESNGEEIEAPCNVGDICTGIVSGITDFGVFIKLGTNTEGLIHISEISWGFVDNIYSFYNVGDTVTVKVVDVKDGKYSCSIKMLEKNPWETASSRYKVGDTVTGVVVKHSKHGVFVSIEAGISGFVHISNFKDEDDMRATMQMGKSYPLKITTFEPAEQKIMFVPIKDEEEKESK